MAGTGWDLKPPGWRLKPPLRRPGRKRTLDERERDSELLSNYEDVLAKLRTPSIRQGKGEEVASWSARLQEIIRQVWKDSGIGVEPTDAPPGEPTDLLDRRMFWKVLMLPESRVLAWVQEAQERAAEGDRLAYQMVAHRWHLTPEQVRAAVQTARKEEQIWR
jgi:hypothetical protein